MTSWEGYLRSLQGSFMIAAVLLVAMLLAYLFSRWLIRQAAPSEISARESRSRINRITVILMMLVVTGLGFRMATIAAINVMPRSDIDRTGVYNQMNDNLKR